MKDSLKFVAATVSGTIGIGFLSGIEYEKFVGNNILLFGAVFLASNILFSQWAKTYRKGQVEQLCYATFKRRSALFTFLIAFTNLLTLVSILSATQELFAEFTSTTLPCFPVVACLTAAAMSKNEKIRNILSTVTALFSICLLIFVPLTGGATSSAKDVPPLLTVC